MNKNIHLCQIILLGLLISFVNTQQQPAKFHTNVLRYASTCREKVSSDSNITLRYVARILETNEIIESRILDLKPGTIDEKDVVYPCTDVIFFLGELTVVKGLEQGIQGMCTGEVRRLSVPTSLHISNDGQVSNKGKIYFSLFFKKKVVD
ncbi:hypothetical protein INT48_000309 [Thamnidium elegans]|uniref:peptidylprolyl isomerase n=1 Tax=Thamnidium elegans TaxID=101142 RepID=A0A8H7STQ0_9FUNG|nr:hypothetical protein INT48_000309 [Thamnidium elegans]